MRREYLAAVVGLAALAILGCKGGSSAQSAGGDPMNIQISSPAFGADQAIPKKYSGEGQNVSPVLSWVGVPAETKELALIVDDPDAPRPQPFVHWVLYKIPPGTTSLTECVLAQEKLAVPPGALQGKNSANSIGYMGPMPPPGHGVHHYHFKLYALDAEFNVKPGMDKDALLKAMKGHVLAEGELVGTYERK